MDRDEERTKRIDAFLDWDDDGEITEDSIKLCRELAKRDPMNATVIMTCISSIAKSALETVKRESDKNWAATERAVQLTNFPKKYTSRDWVVHNTSIVMVLFPEARCNVPWASPLTKEFFNKWLIALKDSIGAFTHDTWAKHQGFEQYFKDAIYNDETKE